MKKVKSVTFGIGGFDESKPGNNVIETIYYTDEELAEMAAAEAKVATKQAIAERLGLTAEELKALLG